jgi:peptidoglycan/LPS O-acetylase OafA/YrhL
MHTKLDGLQVLRAAAALMVMLLHGTGLLAERLSLDLGVAFFKPGFHGVDVFFVLSGFIIHHTAGRVSGRGEFVWRRFVRLFPVYWLVTLLLLVAYAMSPTPEMAFKGDPGVILRSFLLLPSERHVVGVAWTLVLEVGFYALFALLYFRRPPLLYAALGLWALVGWFARPEAYALRALFNPIVLEFLLGCAAAAAHARWGARLAWPALAIGLASFAAAWAVVVADNGGHHVLAFGVSSALVVYAAAGLSGRGPRVLVFLGDASYSIYLLHATAISVLLKLATGFGVAPQLAHPLGGIAILLIALAGCCAFYVGVERPLLAACRRWRGAPRLTRALPTPV